ncbi:SRPBCC domain-containing protein [Allorhizobium undicola]|uniref:SRPBCC domain-containing protein n=1 Tax=Allorhizobium undicola TaxID=78527 RepID=UPI0004826CD3|nr:SRPBCC domain-containing protein [Allorhizobium undicola]
MARIVESTIDIHAPARDVWNVLLAFSTFPEWSRFILAAEGHPALGERLALTMNDGGGVMTFKPVVVACEPQREFGWRGTVGASFLFSGEHRFILEARADGITRFVHRESFSGWLVPLFWKTLNTRTRAAFAAFNIALKERVEALNKAEAHSS